MSSPRPVPWWRVCTCRRTTACCSCCVLPLSTAPTSCRGSAAGRNIRYVENLLCSDVCMNISCILTCHLTASTHTLPVPRWCRCDPKTQMCWLKVKLSVKLLVSSVVYLLFPLQAKLTALFCLCPLRDGCAGTGADAVQSRRPGADQGERSHKTSVNVTDSHKSEILCFFCIGPFTRAPICPLELFDMAYYTSIVLWMSTWGKYLPHLKTDYT